jgi:hypothetical protein
LQARAEKKEVKDALVECSRRQLEELWEGLYAVCTDVLTDDTQDTDQDEKNTKVVLRL